MTRIRWSLLFGLVFGLGAVMCGESGSTGNGSKPAHGGGSGDGGESTGGFVRFVRCVGRVGRALDWGEWQRRQRKRRYLQNGRRRRAPERRRARCRRRRAWRHGSGTLDVLLNLGNGRFPDPPETGRDAKPVNAGAFGDLNGDARPDTVIAVDSIPNSSSLDVYLSEPAGGFTKKSRIPITARAQELLVDQVTGTSDPDVLLMHSQTLPLVGDGTGALTAGSGIFAGPLDAVLVDIDANGERELVGSASGGAIPFARSGTFFEATSRRISPSDFPWLRSTADIDADGRADLTLTGGSSVVWMRSLGGYAFETARPVWNQPANAVLPVTRGALPRRWLVAGADGVHELVETASGVIDTRLGGETGYRMLVADWNRDGIDDVTVTGEVVSLHRGNADGSFSYSGTTLLAGGFVLAEAFFDATGDGLKDIVTVSYQGAITVLPATP